MTNSICLSELVRRRGVGPSGSDIHVTDDIDLSETVKVFLLTQVTGNQPIFINMRSNSRANNRYDFIDFIISCIQQGVLVAGDVLVLDNAPIHTSPYIIPVLSALIQAAQVSLLFLPTYSPELNPCELVFAQCKKYLRYHRRMQNPFWYEIVRGFAQTSMTHMLQYYYKCIWL